MELRQFVNEQNLLLRAKFIVAIATVIAGHEPSVHLPFAVSFDTYTDKEYN